MQVRFWGTRGSLPTAMKAASVEDKIVAAVKAAGGRTFADEAAVQGFVRDELEFPHRGTYGGASSCVEIEAGGNEFIVCDMGSGLREFGLDSLRRIAEDGREGTYHVFLSHPHWDHIMGFPFFVPAFNPNNTIRFYGGHADIEGILRRQQDNPCFPVPLDFMGAKREFVQLDLDTSYDIAGMKVTAKKQHHHGDSFGYRFEKDGRVLVYSTDAEHKLEDPEEIESVASFFKDADLLIMDTMYSLADAISIKEDWGHSSNIVAVDLCHQAGVKHLAMFHHEPVYDDHMIYKVHGETLRYEEIMRGDCTPLEITCSYDGLELAV